MAWGFIPFLIFWLVWLILTFYKFASNIGKYALGGFKK